MTQLQNQLKANYIGNIIDLYTIDASKVGGGIHHLTPSGVNISFDSIQYTPFPIAIDNIKSVAKAAPSRPSLTVSAKPGTILYQLVLQFGDLVGSTVTHVRTLSRFLDGGSTPDPTEIFPKETYTIIQRNSFSQNGIVFILSTPVDNPGLLLPRRQILRDNLGSEFGLYAPGVARTRR